MSNLKKIIILIGDVIALYSALFLMLLIRYGASAFAVSFYTHILPFSLIFIVWLLAFYLADFYRHKTLRNALSLLNASVVGVLSAVVVSTILFYLFGAFFELTPKTNLFLFAIIFFILDYALRFASMRIFSSSAANTIAIGNSPLLKETVEYVRGNPHTGYRIVEWIHETEHIKKEELQKMIEKHRAQYLVVDESGLTKEGATEIMKLLPLKVAIIHFWNFYETIFEKEPINELEESWFLENIVTRRPLYDAGKRLGDIVIAGALSIILSPLFLLIAIGTKFSSKGPAIFSQERMGKGEQSFVLHKFRTMRTNAGGALWTEKNDDRLTGFGKFLRFTHLDELPQLWNIVKGDISFVGPRPERVELARQYSSLPYYEMRHVIKPGLTGWAQINYQPSASLQEAYEKLQYDLFYIKNRSPILDIMIILKTIRYVFASHTR